VATRLAVALLCASLMWLTACGGFAFFAGTSPGFSRVIVVSGTCTSVQLVNIIGPGGGFILVTAVTFFGTGFSNTLNFCGDISGQFPLNRTMTVNYTNGSSCATPVSVVIH